MKSADRRLRAYKVQDQSLNAPTLHHANFVKKRSAVR